MRSRVLIGLALTAAAVLVALIGRDSSSPEDATIQESIRLFNEMSALLETVRDAPSARAAEGKLAPLKERADALGRRINKIPKDRIAAIGARHERDWAAAVERFAEAMAKAEAAGFRAVTPQGKS
jgi:hypothetical protein